MTQKYLIYFVILLAALFYTANLSAYTYNKATTGVISVVIEEPDIMKEINTPLEIKTNFKNSGDTPLKLNLLFSSIETIEFIDGEKTSKTLQRKIDIPAKSEANISVKVIGKSGTVSVHYPVYLKAEWDGGNVSVVQPFESKVSPNPNWFDYNSVPADIPENSALTQKSAEQQKVLLEECTKAMKSGKAATPNTKIFPLGKGLRAVVSFGQSGFLDGKIAVGSPEKFIIYDGIKVKIKDKPLTEFPTNVSASEWTEDKENSTGNVLVWKQNIAIGNAQAVMKYSLRKQESALQLSVDCSEPVWISSVQLGAASEVAERVYFGHGFCIVKPKQFVISTDGHRLSTSHVGFEYPNGLAVLQATTTPPTDLTVNPEKKTATMTIRPGTVMTLLPGTNGMFDCAIRYRSINPKKAADGVKTKAGRFCFDIWGGNYKQHSEIIDNAVLYGLTDSLFIVHSWQRYGYDNRLPDIFPPNTAHGTLEDMQETLKKCDDAGILYGLHDNYIDFYPDAESFGLDYLSFEKNGHPRKAWLNRGVNARSYQFRPDTFKPFLERNLKLMVPQLPQSCYFVDVFSSMTPVDYYDRSGVFHSRSETQKYWGQCFDIIREELTKASRQRQKLSDEKKKNFYAPAISEAGTDFLIGHLDGADCQFGLVSTEPESFRLHIPCEDWERVPWFDAVNHTTFSLHGAGYSGRFECGRSRLTHGIESDDYITAEALLGHPPMVDLPSAFRGAVRKYYLLQPLARELADCEIASVEYVGGDIHRQKIVWKSPDGKTTTVMVNRGKTDWKWNNNLGGTIPPFGFFVAGDKYFGGIWKTESGDIVEGFTAGETFYINGRQYSNSGTLPLKVSQQPDSFKYLGGNRFQCGLLWEAKTSLMLDYSVFIHLVPANWKKGDKVHNGNTEGILSVYGVKKEKPLTEWDGIVITPLNPAEIPNEVPTGKYRLLAGIYDSKGNGGRPSLMGRSYDNARYSIGILNVVRGTDGKITGIALEEDKPVIDDVFETELRNRFAPPKEAADILQVKTKGAFLVDFVKKKQITVTPLPDEPATEISLKTGLTNVSAFDKEGRKTADVSATNKNGFLTFTTEKGIFRYVVE